MKSRNKAVRYFAIFMLALIAIFAIALIVFGGYILLSVAGEKQLWFDLSVFPVIMQAIIVCGIGYIGGGGLICLGVYLLMELIG